MTKPTLTLEQLFTSRAGFAVPASPVQRAICRIADGLPLGSLAANADVRAAIGDVNALPNERPAEMLLLSGIRTGKSLLAAALAVRASQTCDVSKLGPGETARVSVLSLRLDLADVILQHLAGHILARPALRALLVGDPTADTVVLRHPSGRPVEIKVVAGAKAGASLVARWSAGAIFDEAPRMNGAEDGVVNFDDARRAVLGRLLPGAQLCAIGSPWAPFGPVYDMVQEAWGRPSAALVVVRAPAPAMNPAWWTPARVEALRVKDPIAYRTDVLGDFADPESSLFGADELTKASREAPLELPPERGVTYVAAMDPATRSNAWTLAIVKRCSAPLRYVVAVARQWMPQKGMPLSPSAVLDELAAVCRAYGVKRVRTDGWSADAIADLASERRLHIEPQTLSAPAKVELYENLRTHVAQGALELPPMPEVRADLLSVRKRVTQAGIAIVLPRTSDGRHADFAPAIASAVDDASQGAGREGDLGLFALNDRIAHRDNVRGEVSLVGSMTIAEQLEAMGLDDGATR